MARCQRNMKPRSMLLLDKILLYKRSLIETETFSDLLQNISQIVREALPKATFSRQREKFRTIICPHEPDYL